jgi:TatA/E family protein of Tat protein translocase
MFGHLPEFLIVLVIGLIVFGPEKLPEVAANAGKMVREVRQALDVSMNPHDVEVPTDFSSYYYESMARSGDDVPVEAFDTAESGGDSIDSGSRPVSATEMMADEAGVPIEPRDGHDGRPIG